MFLNRKDVLIEIDDLKEIESLLIGLNGNNEKAVNKRMNYLERLQSELTERYNKEMFKIELKKIALSEVSDELEKLEEKKNKDEKRTE